MKSKRTLFLLLYVFFVVGALLSILFFVPSPFFKKTSATDSPIIEKSLVTMQEELLHASYTYKLNVLSSIGENTVKYKCSGKKEEGKESGSCSLPKEVSYTEETKKEVLKGINSSYIEADFLFSLIEEKNPVIKEYQVSKIFTYVVSLNTLKTDITIITDKERILEIRLNNAYENYIVTYSNFQY